MGALLGILAGLPSLISQWINGKQEAAKKQADIELTKINNALLIEQEKSKLAAEMARAEVQKDSEDSNRAKVALQSTGKFFKYSVFWLLSFPFVACLVGFPQYSQYIFDNLGKLPEWYLIIYTSIIAVIWGIPVKGNISGFVVDGIKSSVQNRRDYKLEKAKIDREAYYNAMRKKQGYVSSDDVKKQEAIFDELDKQNQG